MWRQGYTQKAAAKEIGKSPSTPSFELYRDITAIRTALDSWHYKTDYTDACQKKKFDIVANATINILKTCKNFVKSITSDNGFEFRSHEKIGQDLENKFYFVHPYSSLEQGGG